MSDTYFIKNLQCAYCGENNDFEEDAMKSGHVGLPYTSEFGGEFVCDKCKKKNDVVMNFVAVKGETPHVARESEKKFDKWNVEKKRLDSVELDAQQPFPKRQWVWVCSVGVNIGREQSSANDTFERPALVVKKFNNEMYWVVPLTSKQRPFDFYYNFTDPLGHPVALISSQLRLISIKRFKREMYRLPDTDFENLLTQLRNFLKKSEPRTGRGSSGPSESEGTVQGNGI